MYSALLTTRFKSTHQLAPRMTIYHFISKYTQCRSAAVVKAQTSAKTVPIPVNIAVIVYGLGC